MPSMNTETPVKVEFFKEDGSWWGTSPGFYAAAATLEEVQDQARGGLEFHYVRPVYMPRVSSGPQLVAFTVPVFDGDYDA